MNYDPNKHHCYFCGDEVAEGQFICRKRCCRDNECAIQRDTRTTENRLAWKGAAFALRDRLKHCGHFPRYDRWSRLLACLYSLKAMMCVLFGLRGTCYPMYEVATIYSERTYAGWKAGWLAVGPGLFTGWHYEVNHDSEWNM